MKFEEMNLEKSVLDSLIAMGFKEPTQIQVETIPIIKEGHDVIGQSETGSGKTAAFGIPLVEKVEKGKGLQALVLAPTRELAIQIASEFAKFSKLKGLYIQTVYGGVGMEPQIQGLRRAEIMVGTPGRTLDHMVRGTLDASHVKIFVMDEADKMIDMGFVEDIEEIERNIPEHRQTLLFSATMPESLVHIRDRFTKNPKKVKTSSKVREDMLKQFYIDVEHNMKFSLLVHMLEKETPNLAIIFTNSRGEASSIARNLRDNGINASDIHGGLTQARREAVIDDFHKGNIKIMVATDVAARGLDIKNVTHIFNYSIPKNAEDYTNRIGRTARAGETGKAISLLSRDDHDSFRRIIRTFDFDIERMHVEEYRMLPFKRHQYDGESSGRSFGGRGRFGGGRSFGGRGRGYGGNRSFRGERSFGGGRSFGKRA